MKKILILLLAIIMLVSLPACNNSSINSSDAYPIASPDSNFTFTLNADANSYSIAKVDEYISGDIIIPKTYNNLPVNSLSPEAFSFCKNITSITIPDGIRIIPSYAFYGCRELESITIPEGITIIEGNAFVSCQKLQNITLPESVREIKNYAFLGCRELKSITIPKGVVSLGYGVFESCLKLESVVLLNSKTILVDSDFKDCNSLREITYPGTINEWKKFILTDAGKIRFSLKSITVHCIDGDIKQ